MRVISKKTMDCDRILWTLCILFSVAFVCTSFGLLISGGLCFYGKSNWTTNARTCEDVYVSGILMCFIIGVVLFFNLLFCLVNWLEDAHLREPAPRPVVVLNKKKRATEVGRSRSRSRSSEDEVVVNVKKKKLEEEEEGTFAVENPIKKKRSPSS